MPSKDVVCPIACGECCRQYWYEAFPHLEIESYPGYDCPHLKDAGCELERNKRPWACVNHLCHDGEQAYWSERKQEQVQ